MPPHSVKCGERVDVGGHPSHEHAALLRRLLGDRQPWMCANVRTRRFASACSELTTSRRAGMRAGQVATMTSTNAAAHTPYTKRGTEPAVEAVVEDLLDEDRRDEVRDRHRERQQRREPQADAELRRLPEPAGEDGAGAGELGRDELVVVVERHRRVPAHAAPARRRARSPRTAARWPAAPRACRWRRCGRRRAAARGRPAGSWSGGTRRRSSVVDSSRRRPARISASIVGSTELVASSRTSTRGCRTRARASATRCRCAAAERDAPLADDRVVALRQVRMKRVGAREARGPVDRLLGRPRVQRDVLPTVVANRKLSWNTSVADAPQGDRIDVRDVHAADQDLALVRVVQAHQQLCEHALAGARRARRRRPTRRGGPRGRPR